MNKTEIVKHQKALLAEMPDWQAGKADSAKILNNNFYFFICKKDYQIRFLHQAANNKYRIDGLFDKPPFHAWVGGDVFVSANKTWKEIAKIVETKFLPSYYRQFASYNKKYNKFQKDVAYQKQKLKVIADILEKEIADYYNIILEEQCQLSYFFVQKFGVYQINLDEDGTFDFNLQNIPFHVAVELAQFLKRKMDDKKKKKLLTKKAK